MNVDWRTLAIAPQASLLEALKVIDRGALQFALVVEDGRLAGVVTDGDIRRALVRGADTSAPIVGAMNARPVVGSLHEGPEAWRRRMQERGVRHLPVVDALGNLHRLVTESTVALPRDNWVVLMAGGLGTRLRPITERIPKPMIEVGGKPILESIIDTLAHSGFSQFFLSVNHRAHVIEDHFGDGSRHGVEIRYLRETRPMGTAGALSMLPRRPELPMLVMNGDVLTGLDFGAFLDDHCEAKAEVSIGVREYVTQIPYGVLRLDGDRVVGIEEKPDVRSPVSAGVYALSPPVLDLVPGGDAPFDMPDLLSRAIAADRGVRAHVIHDYWIDVGRPADLERARLAFDPTESV